MLKKITSVILIILMLTALFVSCSDKNENNNSNTKTDSGTETEIESETEIKDDLPADINFDGAKVNILSRAFSRYKDELTVDDYTGDVVNDAIYERVLNVQDRLNIEVVNNREAPNDSHGPFAMVEKAVKTDDPVYDLFVGSMYNSMSASVNGYWQNMYDIENLNLSKPYWSYYFSEKASVGDKLYAITGDLAFSMIRLLGVTFFNKNLAAERNLPDLYSVVNNGEWTIDYEINLVKDIYDDLNGNSKKDQKDFFGLGTSNTFSADAYTSSFDLSILTKDSDNYLEIGIDMDKYATAVEKICNMCWKTQGVFTEAFYGSDAEMDDIAKHFSAENYLLISSWLYSTELEYMRDMTDDYGIIPYPKYDESQENYFSYANDQFSVFVIPSPVPESKTPVIGAFLEAMCSVSKKTVLQSYFEIALKEKYSRDSESSAMLDIIVSGFKLDPAWMYSTNMQYLPHNMIRTHIINKTSNIATTYASKEKAYEKSLENLNKRFQNLDD